MMLLSLNGAVCVLLSFFDGLDIRKLLIKIHTSFETLIVTSFPVVYFVSQA